MQIRLTFKINHPIAIPFNYNYQVQSAIYAKLREIDVSSFFHDVGFGNDKVFKGFVFGKLSGKYTIIDKHMIFSDTLSLEIRSPIFEFCDALQRSFELNPSIHLFDTTFKLCGADLINYHINTNSIVCVTNSPVITRISSADGKTLYFSPDDNEFATRLQSNFEKKYMNICETKASSIVIKPLGSHKKTVTNYKGIWINAYSGKYYIEGNTHALEFLYNTGLGEKNSQGFGMFDII